MEISSNARNGMAEYHDTQDIGECDLGKSITQYLIGVYTYNQYFT